MLVSSTMIHSGMVRVVSVLVMLLSMALHASAQEPQRVAPIRTFIVSATEQGKFDVDLADIERQFIKELKAKGVSNLFPSAVAASQSNTGDVYLLELSVANLRRATRLKDGNFKASLWCADVSLAVRSAGSKRILGTTAAYTEREYVYYDEDTKQMAVTDAVAKLADSFIVATQDGGFGDELKGIDTSLSSDFLVQLVLYVIGGIVGVLLLLAFVIAMPNDEEKCKREQPQHRFEKQFEEALALSLATDGFSDAACRMRAINGLNEVLEVASKIEADESKRRTTSLKTEAKYARIAKYAARRCPMDEQTIIDMLRAADEWPYRVLQMAKKLQQEEAYAEK